MASEGQARDLNHSSNNALLELLRSIAPGVLPEDGKKLSEDDVERINEKLTEMLGKDVVEKYSQHRNERGELVNEEGLPIIDVTEPPETADSRATVTALAAEEDELIQLVSLSESERRRLHQERGRILDLLEEEESLEEQRERQRFIEERKEFIRKKMEEATEKDRTKMQKKMGKALLGDIGRNVYEGRSSDDALTSESSRTKKTVSFAPDPVEAKGSTQEEFGGVSLATLRKTNRPTLIATAENDKRPMKVNVIERKPVGRYTLQPRLHSVADSDDESEQDEDEGDSNGKHPESPQAEPLPEDSASESDKTDSDLEDFDYAQHQREIAIEYYAKRGVIGQTAAQAITSHSYDEERDTPPDIGVTESHSKSPISHFKASKLTSSYNASLPSESKSLEGSLLSASGAKTLQRAIRMGKLEQGQLLKGEDDSESEGEGEAFQEVLELLKKGDVYNVGPRDDRALYTNSRPKKETPRTGLAVEAGLLPPLSNFNASELKFKVNRSQAGPSKSGQRQAKSIPFDLKDSTRQAATPMVIERRPPHLTAFPSDNGTPGTTSPSSFPSKKATPAPRSATGPSQSLPSVQRPLSIDSPSRQPPQGPFPMIIDSPSFPLPRSMTKFNTTLATAPVTSVARGSPPDPVVMSRRPTRPPVIMSSTVHETSSKQSLAEEVEHPDNTTAPKSKKVSRFLEQRM